MVEAKLADRMNANKIRLEGLEVIGNELFELKNLKANHAKLHVQHDQIVDHRRTILPKDVHIDFHGHLRAAFHGLN